MKKNEKAAELKQNYIENCNSWREMAKLPRYGGINYATLRAYANGRPIVDNEHRKILGLDAKVTVNACPTCGGACTFDCGTQSVKNKEDPRHLTRTTIYPTTSPAKIAADLLRVTGQRWAPVEGELEY